MKKFFVMLLTAGLFVSCNNEPENTEVTDSITIKTDTSVVVPTDTATLTADTTLN